MQNKNILIELLKFLADYIFLKIMPHRRWVHVKYPVKTCCASDDLSGDMLGQLAQTSFSPILSCNLEIVSDITSI